MILSLNFTLINNQSLLKVSGSSAIVLKDLATLEQVSIKVSQDQVSLEARWVKKISVHLEQE